MKLETELAECEAEVAELRHRLNTVTKLLRNLVAAYHAGDNDKVKQFILLADV